MGGVEGEEERGRLDQFKSWHDEAFLYIQQAVTQEEPGIGRRDVALMMYQRGLGLLDLALCVDTGGPGPAWAGARGQQAKMGATRAHVEGRVRELTDLLAPPLAQDTRVAGRTPPPTYDQSQALAGPPPRPPPPRGPVGASDDEVEVVGEVGVREVLEQQGEVLLAIPGVQIFHVAASGEVSTPSYPDTLRLVRFTGQKSQEGGAPAFLEAGPWTYPLVRGRSPVLRSPSHSNCYMFPDLEVRGGAVGLLLPQDTSADTQEQLEALMAELTSTFKTREDVEQEHREYREFSSGLATGLVRGSEVVGRGMVRGAVRGSELIFHLGDYVKSQLTPEEEARQVDPRVQQSLAAAAWVSRGACRVSGWLVGRVGEATMALGKLAAPHLERGANRALTSLSGQSPHESSSQLRMVGEVASGTVAAVSTMYMALENSSKILAANIANNTVMVVSHKYGADMAAVTDAALATAGNSYLTFYNAAALGPKGIAKRAAKDTGKALVGVDQAAVTARARLVPDQRGLALGEVVRQVEAANPPGPKG